jgi:transposase
MKALAAEQIRSYVSEPDRGRRQWSNDPEAQAPVYANRCRSRGSRGQALHRKRAEYTERSFAHSLETGGLRRVHLRGKRKIAQRMSIHWAAFNLGLLMRRCFGVGTPRGLQGLRRGLFARLATHVGWGRRE